MRSTRTALIRIPAEDYNDIRSISQEMKLSMASAYKVWKHKKLNLNLGWKNYK